MDASFSNLEFFDLSNATEEEIEEIQDILNGVDSNGCVELPWEALELPSAEVPSPESKNLYKTCEPTPPVITASSDSTAVDQAMLYAPPPSVPAAQTIQHPLQPRDIVSSIEAFLPQMQPPISAASQMGAHYPAAPYLVPQTLPYLRAYPHVGVPLFSCTVSNTGELSHMPSAYTPFIPLGAPVSAVPQPHLEKPVEIGEDHDIRPRAKGSDHYQYSRRNKKIHAPTDTYYNAANYTQGLDIYSDGIDDPSSGSNRLAAVPCVPLSVPPSTFPVTSGALPMPSYPPGLHPLTYSGPQAPAAPLYYLPVFNHPSYNRYIAPAAAVTAAPMMMPVSNINVQTTHLRPASESECSTTYEGAGDLKSSESLAASTESIAKTSESSAPVESDSESNKPSSEAETPEEKHHESSALEVLNNECTDNCPLESSEARTESCIKLNIKDENANAEHKIHRPYNDSSHSWADLFKKQCTEVNGVDYRKVKTIARSGVKEPNLGKDLTNGKKCNVPKNKTS